MLGPMDICVDLFAGGGGTSCGFAVMLGPMDICVDLFAGGGGTSCGFKMAMGFDPDIAINHNPAAVAMHKLNHPNTRHYITDIWDVDPVEACGGRPVGMLWASPDCTHHSKARGKKPKDKKIRSLAWVVVRWAREVRPKVIFVENVEEFQTWGPLDGNGQPIKALAGETFRHFIASLRELGYCVEYRELAACDYGAPTTRNRFYLIARCDGDPIVWPEKTHGPGTGRPYRTAAECIDWTIPVRSIFGREKPLVENTLRRIAKGVVKYVLNNPHPFIVAGDLFGIASPHITKFRGGAVGQELTEPMPTITAGGKSERPAGSPHALGIVMPVLVKQTWGEKPCQDVEDPLHTVTTQHNKFALCAAFLAQYHTEQTGREVRGQMLDVPLNVVDASPRYALCCANLLKHYSGVVGQKVDEPIGTVTAIDHHGDRPSQPRGLHAHAPVRHVQRRGHRAAAWNRHAGRVRRQNRPRRGVPRQILRQREKRRAGHRADAHRSRQRQNEPRHGADRRRGVRHNRHRHEDATAARAVPRAGLPRGLHHRL